MTKKPREINETGASAHHIVPAAPPRRRIRTPEHVLVTQEQLVEVIRQKPGITLRALCAKFWDGLAWAPSRGATTPSATGTIYQWSELEGGAGATATAADWLRDTLGDLIVRGLIEHGPRDRSEVDALAGLTYRLRPGPPPARPPSTITITSLLMIAFLLLLLPEPLWAGAPTCEAANSAWQDRAGWACPGAWGGCRLSGPRQVDCAAGVAGWACLPQGVASGALASDCTLDGQDRYLYLGCAGRTGLPARLTTEPPRLPPQFLKHTAPPPAPWPWGTLLFGLAAALAAAAGTWLLRRPVAAPPAPPRPGATILPDTWSPPLTTRSKEEEEVSRG